MSAEFDEYRRVLWSGKAGAYQDSFAGLCAYPIPLLLDAAGVGAGTRVLDVGCGIGTLGVVAIERGAIVTAVDAEPSMIESARQQVPTARIVRAALPELPFPDGSFDVVLANFVINHVGHPARAVAEMLRVTRPGGRIGATIWPRPEPPLQQLWRDVMAAADVTAMAVPALLPENDFPQTCLGLTGLLRGVGMTAVESSLIEWQHRVDPERWWSGAANGVASIGFVVSQQDPLTVRRMKSEYERLILEHLDAEGLLRMPTAAVLATALRPV